jgi:phosphohistidine phosphatase SixA
MGSVYNYIGNLHPGGVMAQDADYKFETFEEYYGDEDTVKKQIDECHVCGSKLLLSHLPDYKNLLVQETARCLECGAGNRKVIHILN